VLSPAEPGHNPSSSPSATLADRAERKVPKHRSRANPTFDQRHDSELMHIRPNSWRRTLPKVFRLYNRWWAQECPFIINPVFPGTCINLSWRNAKNGSILCGYGTHGMVKQQEAVEKVYTGTIWITKRQWSILFTGAWEVKKTTREGKKRWWDNKEKVMTII